MSGEIPQDASFPLEPQRIGCVTEGVVPGPADSALPEHLLPVEHPSHDAHCSECGYWITVGPSGTEYGHKRGSTGGSAWRCPYRPGNVDPKKM